MRLEAAQALPEQTRTYRGRHWNGEAQSGVEDQIAEEVPVALVYNGISHVVMLATPQDLEDFGIGFSLSEGVVQSAGEVYDLDVTSSNLGIEIGLTIASERFALLKDRRRNLAGRTGCGICGTESLQNVVRQLPRVPGGLVVDPGALHCAFEQLRGCQPLHALTGAAHAAAWSDIAGTITLVREDVGRHNALDKLIGAIARRGLGFNDGFAVITSRASCEMVQKAAAVGIGMLAAISAPTGLAIRLAEDCGITVVGFARKRSHTVYTHTRRIQTTECV